MIKRFICLIISLCMVLSCVMLTDTVSVNTKAATTDYVLADTVQNGQILQCWNWSFDNIKANIPTIAEQGFTAIQTSPVQPSKESTKESWSTAGNSMWVYYQPIDFTFETNTRSALGTKEDFIEMCEVAHEYGIKVIVDTIFNHLANENAGNTVSSQIPSDIKDDSSCWHSINTNISNYSDRYDSTHHCLGGLPDLNTGSSKIQNYAIEFMKECIDAGADGFRFDAAKHIETPSDSSGTASDFWPNVLSAATEYALSSRGFTPYYYGELLDSPGGSLSIKAYTEYMSVTDNQTSNNIRNSVANGSASGACASYISNGASTSKTVQWNESHDTYYDGSSKSVSNTNLKKTWAIVGSRAKVCGMYLARPSSSSTKLGAADVTAWADKEVKEINKFKNLFIGESEYLAYSGSIVYNERGTSGVVLANVGGSSTTVSVTANKMASGTYTDAISGNIFTVSNGKISGTIGSTGIAVVYNEDEVEPPTEDTQPGADVPAGYYLVGTLGGENLWSASALTEDRLLTLSTTDDGEYTLDYTFSKGDEVKVVYYNGTYITTWYKDSESDSYTIGSSKVGDCTLYFNPNGNSDYSYNYFTVQPRTTKETDAPTDAPTEPETDALTEAPTQAPTEPTEPPTDEETEEPTEQETEVMETAGYYMVGSLYGENYWFVDETSSDRKLTLSEEVTGQYTLDWTFASGDKIKVVYYDGTEITQWYNSSGDNYGIGSSKAGDCTVYFRPEGNTNWSYFYFTVIPKVVEETKPATEETEPETEPAPAKPIKVENFSYTSTANTISLSWDEADGCYKYWIYKYNSDKDTWSIAASTYETSGVVKNLDPNTTYQLKVIGKFTDDGSYMSLDNAEIFEATTSAPAAPDTMSITPGLNEATITWDTVDGATKYWIYKASNLDGPYYIAGSTTDTSAVMTNLRNDMTYYFRIASLTYQNGVPFISDPMDSPYVSVETPKTEEITPTVESDTSTTATVSWSGLDTADKYWVLYSTDNATWTTGGTTTAATTFTLKSLTPNTVYNIKIRARYVGSSGETKTFDYMPVTMRTAYSDEPFITFTQEGNYLRLIWGDADNLTDITKTWVYVYDATGTQVAMSSTSTNTALIKKFDDYENCTYVLYTVNADGVYGYLTKTGGEKYHN